MDSTDLENKIKTEIGNQWDFKNLHNVDLIKCLIKPIKQKYIDAGDETLTKDLWTVLEEKTDGSGYKIFYDETVDAFGLGILSNKNELVSLGIYGAFMKTLYMM